MYGRRLVLAAGLVASFMWLTGSACAAPMATKAEAEAMVKKAIAYINKNGREKAFAAFSDPKGEFIDRDLYVSVFDPKGVNLAHGVNPKIVGKNMWDYRDPDGKYPIRECWEIINSKGSGWVVYKFVNPVTKDIQSKDVYAEGYDGLGIWVGTYKR